MNSHQSRWNKECAPRERRQVCHQSFWCDEDRAHALNLSPGGMCFRVSRRVEPGEVVTLHQGPSLQVKARVAWTRRLDSCTEVGVQFLDHRDLCESWLSFLQTQEPLLALPAPGQTFQPTFRPAASAKTRPPKIGKSWGAAIRLLES